MKTRIPLIALLIISTFSFTGCFVPLASSGSRTRVVTAVARTAYNGPHPIYDTHGNEDWCAVEGVHYHTYAPDSDDFYVIDNGRYVFVGDPSYYVRNITFDTYHYMGPHPLPIGNAWCYIDGPHRHHWAASGYYNYTVIGGYRYYTYYGKRNSYYNPAHAHYDLYSYYNAHPPVRYTTKTVTKTAGMRDYAHTQAAVRETAPQGDKVYSAPLVSGRQQTTGRRNGTAAPTTSRPATTTTTSVSRPATTTTTSVSRPGSTTTTSTTISRPTTGSVSRPATSTTTTTTTTYQTQPGTTVSRPSAGQQTVSRPSTSTASRPSQGSTSYSRPSSGSTPAARPASGGGGRVDSPSGKGQYYDDEDEENNSRSGGGSSRGASSSRSISRPTSTLRAIRR